MLKTNAVRLDTQTKRYRLYVRMKAGLYAIDDPDGCRKVFADKVKKS